MGKIRVSALHQALGLVSVLGCASAWAGPLSLTATESVTHDSNFARTETRLADTISATSLQLALDKQYGRQYYFGSAKVTAYRYKNNGDKLNNDSKDLSLGVASEVASNWKVQLNGAYGENLNQFENNLASNHLVRNIRTTKSASGQVTYGLSGIWALVTTAGKSSLSYSDSAYFYQNNNQDTLGLKAVYYSSDLLSYSMGVRKVESSYPSQNGEKVNEKDLDLSTDWAVSGLSQLSATVSWTQNRRVVQSDRKFNGLTGYLNWSYTPRGLMSYGVNLYKTSNSDQFNRLYTGMNPFTLETISRNSQLAYNNKVTSASAYARWAVTGKLSLSTTATLNHYGIQQDDTLLRSSVNDNSQFKSLGLNGSYAFDRHFQLYGGVSTYHQTRDINRNPYSGMSVNVAASFMLD